MNKLLLIDMKKNIKQFALLIILLVIGIVVFLSGILSYQNLKNNKEDIYRKTNFSNIQIYSFDFKEKTFFDEKFRNINDPNRDYRIFLKGSIQRTDKLNATADIITYKPAGLNKLLLLGNINTDILKGNEIFILKSYAEKNNIHIGETLQVNLNSKELNFKVKNFVDSPEYIYAIKSSDSIIPDAENFSAIFASEDYIREQLLIPAERYNNVALDTEDENQVEHEFKNEEIIKKNNQLSELMLSEDIDMIKEITVLFSIIFIFISLLALIVLQRRYINNQKRQYGVLLALGFSKKNLRGYYYKQSLILWIISTVISAPIAYVTGFLITYIYGIIVNIPVSFFVFDFSSYIFVSIFALIIIFITTMISIRTINTNTIQTLIRGEVKKENIKFNNIGIHIKYKRLKSILLGIIKNPFKSISNILPYFCTIILIFLPIQLFLSINYSINHQYGDVQKYDYKIIFNGEMTKGQILNILSDVPSIESVQISRIEQVKIDENQSINLISTDNLEKHYGVIEKTSDKIKLPQVILERIGKKSGIITLKNRDAFSLTIDEGEPYNQYIAFNGYISDTKMKNIIGRENIYNSATIQTNKSISDYERNQFIQKLNKHKEIFTIDETKTEKSGLKELLLLAYAFVIIMIFFALVMISVSTINFIAVLFEERRDEMGSLMILGFSKTYILCNIILELLILVLIAIPPAYATSIVISKYLDGLMSNKLYQTPHYIGWDLLLIPIITLQLIFIFTIIICNKKLRKIKIGDIIRKK